MNQSLRVEVMSRDNSSTSSNYKTSQQFSDWKAFKLVPVNKLCVLLFLTFNKKASEANQNESNQL